MPGAAGTTYDLATGVLTLPAVKVGNDTFLDVKLLNTGNFVFTLQAATAMPATISAELDAFARALEAQFATAVPPTGEARMSLTDACWRSNGRTRANFIADYEANLGEYLQRDAYQIGRRIANLQVLALREVTNPDRSTRRELDVEYDLVYRNGTTFRDRQKLVSGSSSGTPGCLAAQTGSAWRALGNQQLVGTAVRASNIRDQRYSISSGAPLSPAVTYRREIEFAITDPMGNATYAIVTGPGPTNTTGNVTRQFSMKFLSVRLLRSAPELVGKPGNFLNWRDDDSWRNCRLASGAVPVVDLVDCVAGGASSNVWGWGFTSTPDAAADRGFEAQGWVAGGVYRFDVYNDDGWKTVNGHASRTPIATYHATLDRLPFRFTDMDGEYPAISLGNLTGAQLAANARSATPAPLALSWTAPGRAFPGSRPTYLHQIWEFHQGAKIGNPGTNLNPGYRTLTRIYPGGSATWANVPVTPRLPDQSGKTYTEYLLYYAEPGTLNTIRSRISLQ